MRHVTLAVAGLLVLACAKQEQAPAMDTAAAAPPPPAAFSVAEAAGTWNYVAKSQSDSVLVTAELNATADPAGWTLVFPGRPALPMTVTVSGDSAMTKMAPYKSVLRKGVMVTTDGVLRMSGGKLVGTGVAHYSVKTADSVLHLVIEATRKQ